MGGGGATFEERKFFSSDNLQSQIKLILSCHSAKVWDKECTEHTKHSKSELHRIDIGAHALKGRSDPISMLVIHVHQANWFMISEEKAKQKYLQSLNVNQLSNILLRMPTRKVCHTLFSQIFDKSQMIAVNGDFGKWQKQWLDRVTSFPFHTLSRLSFMLLKLISYSMRWLSYEKFLKICPSLPRLSFIKVQQISCI